jgi:hypothetical protein
MNGGPSQLETFDPKPGTRSAGPGRAIDTALPGVRFGDGLPRLAAMAGKLTVVRSLHSREGNHERAQYLLRTGHVPSGTVRHPSLGAWVSHDRAAGGGQQTARSARSIDRISRRGELPDYVAIRGPGQGSGFLGATHAPFVITNPLRPLADITLAADVDAGRFDRRLTALGFLDRRFGASTEDPRPRSQLAVRARAVRLMRSRHVRAFELGEEPESTRRAYGPSEFGLSCLLARRLVEVGVPFVEVTLDGWDTHVDNFTRTRVLTAQVDAALSALIADLEARQLLARTLIVWMGEFGRSPTLGPNEGRDHHPAAQSVVLAGGGVRPGLVYGATSPLGDRVVKDPVTVPAFFATVATLLGLDPERELISPQGRPIALADTAGPVRALLAE